MGSGSSAKMFSKMEWSKILLYASAVCCQMTAFSKNVSLGSIDSLNCGCTFPFGDADFAQLALVRPVVALLARPVGSAFALPSPPLPILTTGESKIMVWWAQQAD
jgi:hypothetical protein